MTVAQIANAYVNAVNADKGDIRRLLEERYALYFATADDLRGESPTHLQLALIAGALYIYDPADISSGDAGGNSPEVLNTQNGRRYKPYRPTPRKNYVLNSNFQVWDRGGGPFTGGEQYTANQWRVRPGGPANRTFQRAPGLTPDAEFSFSWDKQSNSGASDILEARIEDVRTLAGDRVVISFDVQSFSGDIDFGFDMNQNYDDGGGQISTGDSGRTANGTLQRVFAIHQIAELDDLRTIGGDSYVALRIFRGAAAQNGEIRVGNVKVERVDDLTLPVMTAYEKPCQCDERPRLQRYYWEINSEDNTFARICVAVATSADRAIGMIHLPTTMRKDPDLVASATSTFAVEGDVSNNTPDAVSILTDNDHVIQFNYDKTGAFTAGDTVIIRAAATNAMRLQFSSEL